jgi:hypothetical protein
MANYRALRPEEGPFPKYMRRPIALFESGEEAALGFIVIS